MSDTGSERKVFGSYLEAKRIHKTPPPFQLLKTMVFPKPKNSSIDIFRMNNLHCNPDHFKRPETASKVEGNLKIIGKSQPYYRFYQTQIKPKTSQTTLRKCKIQISRHKNKGQSESSSVPKQDLRMFSKGQIQIDQTLYRNSAKLQILYKQKQLKIKNIVIILTVQFILQQSRFWKQDEISEDVSKLWKKLQSSATLVWIIKKQKSFKKLETFAQKAQISLDTVCLLRKPKIKKVITVKLNCLQVQFNFSTQQKIIYIDVLPHKHSSQRNNQHYWNKFPLTLLKNMSIHFLQYEQSPKNLLHNIFSITQKQSNRVINMDQILINYQSYLQRCQKEKLKLIKKKLTSKKVLLCEQQSDIQQQTLRNMEELKKNLIKQSLIKCRFEGKEKLVQKDSVHYLVGDLLKRNFEVMIQMSRSNRKYLGMLQSKQLIQGSHNIVPLKYDNLIFLWRF